MQGDLSGPGTRVLLVGSSSYADGSVLDDLPSVPATVDAVAEVLTVRCGVPAKRITCLMDPDNPITLANALTAVAVEAQDVLLFWYVGHGLAAGDNELHLSTRATVDLTQGLPSYQALPFGQVYELLRDKCQARTVVLVVDACNAGGAARGWLSSLGSGMAQRHRRFLLASAAWDEHALAPPGARTTAFSGELVRLLEEGDRFAGGPAWTLDRLARALERTLPKQNFPAPEWWSVKDVGNLRLAANVAYPQPEQKTRPEDAADANVADEDMLCPYPGLEAFGEHNAHLFHGRGRTTREILAEFAKRLDDGLILVTGPSGSGKSSVIRAGLLPALDRGEACDGESARWPKLLITPGSDPLAALARRLSGLVGESPDELVKRLRDNPAELAVVTRAVLRRMNDAVQGRSSEEANGVGAAGDGRLVLVVDQFEELFTQCTPPDREALLRAIDATQDKEDATGLLVLCVIRADFLHHCTSDPLLAASLRRGPLVVEAMTRDEIAEAVEVPARAVGLTVGEGLVDVVLADLGANGPSGYAPGALPLFAHALLETWHHSEGRQLTVGAYHEGGGFTGAVGRTANQLYDNLTPSGQATTRRILVRLVDADDDTRRHLNRTSLLAGIDEPKAAGEIVDQLVAARLLTVGDDRISIAHEALVHAWPRLREWFDADRDLEQLRQEIEPDARRWDEARSRTRQRRGGWWLPRANWADLLYRGGRLAAVHERLADRTLDDPLAVSFLRASDEEEVRAARLRRGLAAALVALAILTLAAAGYAIDQRRNTEELVAFYQQLRDETRDERIALLSERATELEGIIATGGGVVDISTDPEVARLTRLVDEKRAEYNQAEQSVICEVEGTCGSGLGGGSIAYDEKVLVRDRLLVELAVLEQQLEEAVTQAHANADASRAFQLEIARGEYEETNSELDQLTEERDALLRNNP